MRLFHASARGATPAGRCCKDGTGNFNPRPPRGGRRPGVGRLWRGDHISIHAPREGGDLRTGVALGQNLISIHAPREGGDRFLVAGLGRHEHFNPRPPRGGRPKMDSIADSTTPNFNPRPPRGGRQKVTKSVASTAEFQSTPPARGATPRWYSYPVEIDHFNPRPPRGGRRTID